jgi:hypothetical protein
VQNGNTFLTIAMPWNGETIANLHCALFKIASLLLAIAIPQNAERNSLYKSAVSF